MSQSPAASELSDLLGQLCDGILSRHDVQRLEDLVLNAPDLRRQYIEILHLHAALRWNQPEHVQIDGKQHPFVREGRGQEAAKPPTLQRSSAYLALFSISGLYSLASQRVALSIALVAIVFYGAFTLVAWNLRPGRNELAVGRESSTTTQNRQFESVATVTATYDCSWRNVQGATQPREGLPVQERIPLQMDRGLIELQTKRGVQMLVKGPADWTLDAENSVSLRSGSLVAMVPPQAIGFTVTTPSAQVVDLGTEFGVEVSKQGATEVQVFHGKVELRPDVKRGDSSSTSKPITLVAGAARRIEQQKDGTSIVSEIVPTSDRFVRSVRPEKFTRIGGVAAMASSTDWDAICGVNHLVDGSGLQGERHLNRASDTMWYSALGRVKGEFVLFDLIRPHRLKEMKVWNYNAVEVELFKTRGVKQADIYVSSSGHGDPLSRPDAWQLVVTDHKFSPADGTPNYNTPDVITLDDVEARFVAIVVDDCLGSDPRDEGWRCVGLSEVQFFGKRVSSQDPPVHK